MTDQNIVEVLLAEDNVDDGNLIIQTLKQHHPDVNIKLVHDGAEALDCVFGTGPFQERNATEDRQ